MTWEADDIDKITWNAEHNHTCEVIFRSASQVELGTQITEIGDRLAVVLPQADYAGVGYDGKNLHMRSDYKIYDDGIYFITSSIVEWLPIFTSKPYFDILISSIRFCQTKKNLSVYAYVILDNHFHMICQAPKLDAVMQSLKRHAARAIIARLEADGKRSLLHLLRISKKRHKRESLHQVWQEGYHPQQMMSDTILAQKIEYIHYNPVERSLVLEPQHWVYSSAKDFLTGEKGYIELQKLDIL